MQHTINVLGFQAFRETYDANRETPDGYHAVKFTTRYNQLAFFIQADTGYDVYLLDSDAPEKQFKTYDYPQLIGTDAQGNDSAIPTGDRFDPPAKRDG